MRCSYLKPHRIEYSAYQIQTSTMVFTAAQQIAFFEDADQMNLTTRTRTGSLVVEGIISVDDLAEWKDNGWDQWSSNCKKPDRIPDPNDAALLIAQAPLTLSVKSLKRLKIAFKLV